MLAGHMHVEGSLMKRLVMSTVLAFAVIASMAATPSAGLRLDGSAAGRGLAAAQQPITKDGWWIRVNPANEATNVSWRFGAEPNRLGAPVRWVKAQNPEEFDLAPALRGLEAVHVAAIGLPPKATVSFCLFFRNRGVQLFEFTQEKNAEVNFNQQDVACVP
jgi:hypothetical protein